MENLFTFKYINVLALGADIERLYRKLKELKDDDRYYGSGDYHYAVESLEKAYAHLDKACSELEGLLAEGDIADNSDF